MMQQAYDNQLLEVMEVTKDIIRHDIIPKNVTGCNEMQIDALGHNKSQKMEEYDWLY